MWQNNQSVGCGHTTEEEEGFREKIVTTLPFTASEDGFPFEKISHAFYKCLTTLNGDETFVSWGSETIWSTDKINKNQEDWSRNHKFLRESQVSLGTVIDDRKTMYNEKYRLNLEQIKINTKQLLAENQEEWTRTSIWKKPEIPQRIRGN